MIINIWRTGREQLTEEERKKLYADAAWLVHLRLIQEGFVALAIKQARDYHRMSGPVGPPKGSVVVPINYKAGHC